MFFICTASCNLQAGDKQQSRQERYMSAAGEKQRLYEGYSDKIGAETDWSFTAVVYRWPRVVVKLVMREIRVWDC